MCVFVIVYTLQTIKPKLGSDKEIWLKWKVEHLARDFSWPVYPQVTEKCLIIGKGSGSSCGLFYEGKNINTGVIFFIQQMSQP